MRVFRTSGRTNRGAVLAPTGASGMGGATYAVLAGAAAGLLAFAVLATPALRWRGVK
jgi:hypothetical protein